MGSEKLGPPVVLLDANQLYPFHLRNLLVQLGVERLIDVRWTDAIHEEWIANLVRDGRVTRERLLRTRDIMKRVLPSADVHGYPLRSRVLPSSTVYAALQHRGPILSSYSPCRTEGHL